MEVILGIDAGGTSTKLCWFSTLFEPLLYKEYPGIQLSTTDEAVAARLLVHYITDSLPTDANVTKIGLGMAGLSGDARKASLQRELSSRCTYTFLLMNDAEAAFSDFFEEHWGCLLVNGTGSVIVVGVYPKLQYFGGFGPILGDDASGLSIGIKALRHWAADIQTHRHSLLRRVLECHYGKKDRASLIQLIYKEELKPSELTPFVFEAIDAGCTISMDIIRKQLDDFSDTVVHALSRYTFDTVPVGFHGGLYNNTYFASEMVRILSQKDPRITRIEKHANPCLATAKLAQKWL